MAGHSKWANIRFRKSAQDQKRGKLFTRLNREIIVATKTGGADAQANAKLRHAISRALAQNMSKEAIDKAIAKGSGSGHGQSLEEIFYEGYSAGGAAVLVRTLTDNRNRTAAEIRHIFNKYDGNLGTSGSVQYLFEHTGWLQLAKEVDEDELLNCALEHGATDVTRGDSDQWEILCAPADLSALEQSLSHQALPVLECKLVYLPQNDCMVPSEIADKVMEMLDKLDEQDDSQEVYCNAQFADLSVQL